MNNRFVLILVACVLGFFGILFLTKKDASSPSGGSSASALTQHTYGEGKSGVVFMEYGDFECSGCYSFYPIVEQVKEKYKDQITFQFRHLPLTEIQTHEHALLAAKASEAAHIQGKFWEMYNKLYTNQPSWGELPSAESTFESYAKELGLDTAKFLTDMKSEAVNSIVQADRGEAKKQGYNSTPTFLIDGELISAPQPSVEFFSAEIDKAIANKAKSGQQ
jgi:protein-disulfide isomerase